MIGRDDDRSAFQPASVLERVQQPADLSVHDRDRAVVRIAIRTGIERLGHGVWGVRIEEMDPQEERRRVESVHPADGCIHHFVCRPAETPESRRTDDIVVHVESAFEAATPVQHHRSHERAGGKSGGMQLLGK
jgi:hypothetical protein